MTVCTYHNTSWPQRPLWAGEIPVPQGSIGVTWQSIQVRNRSSKQLHSLGRLFSPGIIESVRYESQQGTVVHWLLLEGIATSDVLLLGAIDEAT